jgi:hypothetical protein
MRGSSRAISATTFPASRSSCRATCRARAPRAANWVYNIAPQGRHGAGHRRPVAVAAAGGGDKRINFDTTKFIYIGNPNVENNTTAAWHTSGIKTIDDAKKREVTVGRDRRLDVVAYPKAMNALIGTNSRSFWAIPAATTSTLRWSAARWSARLEQLVVVEGDPSRMAHGEEDQHSGADRARQGA